MTISSHFPVALGQYLVKQGLQPGKPKYTSHCGDREYSLVISVDPKKAMCVLTERQPLDGVPSWTFFGTYAFNEGKSMGAVEVSQNASAFSAAIKVEELIDKLTKTGPYLRE